MPSPTPLLPLPPQPAGVPWPTEAWPTGPLDPLVDRRALETLLAHAFARPEPEDLERTHAFVAVQGGRIVAERYAEGVSPDDTFHSWSMAKSITSALVGILVRQYEVRGLSHGRGIGRDLPSWRRASCACP